MAGNCHVNVKGAYSVVLEGCTHSSMLVFCFFSGGCSEFRDLRAIAHWSFFVSFLILIVLEQEASS